VLHRWNQNPEHKTQEDMEVEPDTENFIKRVFFNINALGHFLRRAVTKSQGNEGKETADEREDPKVRDIVSNLQGFVNDTILTVLPERQTDSRRPPEGKRYSEDRTETQLTADLYVSHFSLRRTVVSVPTEDLLDLTNLLWTNMQQDTMEELSIKLQKDNDCVLRLLQRMKQKRVGEKEKSGKKENKGEKEKHADSKTPPWNKDIHIWPARMHGECHNLTMRTRFLEFQHTEQNEPVICESSLAPIPRFMAKDSLQQARTLLVVKPLLTREENKDYPELEALLQEISGAKRDRDKGITHPIQGQSYTDMQTALIDIQKQISSDVEEGRLPQSMNEMLQRLENGKRCIDRIRERSEDEQRLREFIDRSVENRFEYSEYLKLVRECFVLIRSAYFKYRENLDKSFMILSKIHSATETCDIPDEIKLVAESKSERLTFEKAKKNKLRQRRTNPTPAQRVLEQLQNNTEDGKQSEELKNKVGVPARTFTLRELESKGVIVRVHERISQEQLRKMCFSFQYKDEGFDVQVFIKTTLLKDFRITREDIVAMQAGHKVNDMEFGGDNFLWLNCFRTQRLLAWMYAEGAL